MSFMHNATLTFVSLALFGSVPAIAQDVPVRAVAVSGGVAPDPFLAPRFAAFDFPIIDNEGRISFIASLDTADPLVSPDNAIVLCSEIHGALTTIARTSRPAPGTPDIFTGLIGVAAGIDSGIAFGADLSFGSPGFAGSVFSQSDADPTLLARLGEDIPGLPGERFGLFVQALPISGSDVVFSSMPQDSFLFEDVVVARSRPGGIELIAVGGQVAPGTGGALYGDTFASVRSDGELRWGTELREDPVLGIDRFNSSAAFRYRDGVPTLMYRRGDPLPGIDGAVMGFTWSVVSGPNDRTAFIGVLDNNDSRPDADTLYQLHNDEFSIISQAGESPPGAGDRTIECFFTTSTNLNSRGEGMVLITFDDGDQSLYRFGPDWLEPLAIEGELSPAGVPYGPSFVGYSTNERGDAIFTSGPAGASGLYAYVAAADAVVPIAVPNVTQLDIASPGSAPDLRDINRVSFRGFANSGGDGLNEDGQVVFQADYGSPFLEGEGIFVASLPAPDLACSPADLVPPFGITDLDDIDAFIPAFLEADPSVDFAPPFGVVDLDDLDVFIVAFLAGCP